MCQLEVNHTEYFVFEMYLPTWIWHGPSPVARETEQMMHNTFGGSTILPNLEGRYCGSSESTMICRFLVPVGSKNREARLNSIAGFLFSRAQSIADAWGEQEVWVAYVGIQKVMSAKNWETEKRAPANRVYWTLAERKQGFQAGHNVKRK